MNHDNEVSKMWHSLWCLHTRNKIYYFQGMSCFAPTKGSYFLFKKSYMLLYKKRDCSNTDTLPTSLSQDIFMCFILLFFWHIFKYLTLDCMSSVCSNAVMFSFYLGMDMQVMSSWIDTYSNTGHVSILGFCCLSPQRRGEICTRYNHLIQRKSVH